MTRIGEILYCHATRQTRTVGPGHWFFHTGQWVQCAYAWRERNGKWKAEITLVPRNKQQPDEATFGSIEEVKRFVSAYFERPVIEVKPSEMPRPEDL
jgi:hypothetical protein